MFKIGLPNKNSKYPGAERLDQPKFVLELDLRVASVVDVDRWVDPMATTCDAYVLTDKGVHLFWLHPNRPTSAERDMGDKLHRDLNPEMAPLFFQSKHDGKLRTCAAKTSDGLRIANEYNTKALGAWALLQQKPKPKSENVPWSLE